MAIFSFLKNQKSWRVIFRYEARVRPTDLYNVMYFQYMRGCWPISKNLIKYWISFLSFFFFGWAKNFSVPPCSLTQSRYSEWLNMFQTVYGIPRYSNSQNLIHQFPLTADHMYLAFFMCSSSRMWITFNGFLAKFEAFDTIFLSGHNSLNRPWKLF